jgi:hypothetical protein
LKWCRGGGYGQPRVNSKGFHGDEKPDPRLERELFDKEGHQQTGINFSKVRVQLDLDIAVGSVYCHPEQPRKPPMYYFDKEGHQQTGINFSKVRSIGP